MANPLYYGHTTTKGNADLDAIIAGEVQLSTLPGAASRTTARLRDYLANNGYGFNPVDFAIGVINDGVADARGAIITAQSMCGIAGRLTMTPGTYRVSANLTITSALHMQPGAKLKPDNGVVITIDGPYSAELAKCFDLSAGGVVRFGKWRPESIFPQWWGATGAGDDGVTDDGAAIVATFATANAIAAGAGFKRRYGVSVVFTAGTYLSTQAVVCYPGVTVQGDGLWTTVLVFSLPNSVDGLSWDKNAPGYAPSSGFGYGGLARNIKLTTLDFTNNAKSCRHLLSTYGVVDFALENVALEQAGGHLLHIEDAIGVTLSHVSGHQCKGDAGLYIGSPASVSTTVRSYHTHFSECQNGPNYDVAGLSLDFFGLTSESAGSGGVQAGAFGFRLRYGTAALYSPYFEDNGDAEMWLGSDANATRTTVIVTNPTTIAGANNLPGKSALILDRVAHAAVEGGDLTARQNTVEMTNNCGPVDLTMFGTKEPILTSGLNWRYKADLNYRTGQPGRAQVVTKAAIAPAGTMVATIPTMVSQPCFLQAFAEVYFEGAPNLRTLLKFDIAHAGDGFGLGGMVTTVLRDGNSGNFHVVAGDFAATFAGTTVAITYTNSNGAGAGNTNLCQIHVTGIGIAGTVTAA